VIPLTTAEATAAAMDAVLTGKPLGPDSIAEIKRMRRLIDADLLDTPERLDVAADRLIDRLMTPRTP
jgi:hypothetical protein